MTTTLLLVAAAASIAAYYTLAPAHHVPPPPQSAAERGANAHYIYHKTWHRVNETLPKGERAGAHSYSYVSGSHREIPQPSSAGFYGSIYANAYDQVHYVEDAGSLPSRAASYTGETFLPPGTWTGHDAAPEETLHVVTWREDAQGRIRSDEISGTAMKVTMPSSVPAKHP